EDKSLYPLILFAPIKEERELAIRLNKEFGNTLVTVEADLTAVTSVLKNVDLLVTPDTVIKHIADLVDTRTLEISLGPSPFLKQGPVSVGNFVITDRISDRNFRTDHYKGSILKTRIKAKDVYEAVRFSLEKTETPKLDPGISFYKVSRDQVGTRFDIVAGDIPWTQEIDRHASRYFIGQTTRKFQLQEIKQLLASFPVEARRAWAREQKERASATLKDILSTVRTLAILRNNSGVSNEFITNLDKLLTHCKNDDLMALPVLFFRAKVENIQAEDRKDSVNQTEKLLFELKGYVQKAYEITKSVESDKSTTIDKSQPVTNGYNV
ncbi:MAG: hypothetical protein KC493_04545, partial [Bacteriovoracaceae bacterium]|nr:hypothetical protein [Bacteriovoracaceae bacterium]